MKKKVSGRNKNELIKLRYLDQYAKYKKIYLIYLPGLKTDVNKTSKVQ